MICKNCGSKFSSPLYLFNGSSTCPRCKREILQINNLTVTKENEELYNLSRIAYLRYLSPKSAPLSTGAKTSLTRQELLTCALNNCQASALLGNPFAIFQMGYFSEHFPSQSKNQLERIRLAFEYYQALCYSELTFVKAENGAKEFSEEDFLQLKVSTGKCLLKLCKKYSALLKSSVRYDYKKNKARLNALYKTASFEEDYSLDAPFNRTESALNILTSSRSKTKAPLFGIFLLSGTQFKDLFTKGGKTSNPCKKLVSKDPDFLRYMICNESGQVKNDQNRYFSRLASVEDVDELINSLTEKDYLYLYFFNAYGKHPYLTGKQIQTVKRELEENEQALLLSLSSFILEDTAVFFDDDIEQYKTGKNAYGATTELITSVRGEN